MNTATTSGQHHNTSEHTGRSRRLGGRFALAGAILIGSMAIAGTAGAADPGPGDTDPPSRRPGDTPSFTVEPTVPDYRAPNVEDHRQPIDRDALVEGQFGDGDTIDACDDDCPRHDDHQDNGRGPDQQADPDDRIREDGAWIDEPIDEQPDHDDFDEDYGDDYPHGCGEDELVACPDKYPEEELTCEDYDDEICDEYVPEETEHGTTTTIVTDEYEPTTTTTPLEEIDVEVKGKQTGGDSLAYTGSNSKLPLIGAGLLAAGGVAAGLSIMSRRNKADRA